MTRFMVLATALALLPASALANAPQPSVRANIPAIRIPPVCTPTNPCAVPSPAISRLESLRRATLKDRATAQAR